MPLHYPSSLPTLPPLLLTLAFSPITIMCQEQRPNEALLPPPLPAFDSAADQDTPVWSACGGAGDAESGGVAAEG